MNSITIKWNICRALIYFILQTSAIFKVVNANRNFLRRRLQLTSGYKYNQGNCPDAGSTGLPCAPSNLGAICDKANTDQGSFNQCLELCRPAYCCVYDAKPNNLIATSCASDENCAAYAYCYIVFWKLHDTIGPSTYLRMTKQNDDAFFDFNDDAQFQSKVLEPQADDFYTKVVFHHFADSDKTLEDMTDPDTGDLDVNRVFDNPDNWV